MAAEPSPTAEATRLVELLCRRTAEGHPARPGGWHAVRVTRDQAGERNLNRLLQSLEPRLNKGDWVFVTVDLVPVSITPLATFRESEGLSLLVRRDEADAAGLPYDFIGAWISLTVHSALDAVGLTAAVAAQLATADISCNVVATRHHDHLFVPHEQAERALGLIEQLSISANTV
jgi:hypothetical protein